MLCYMILAYPIFVMTHVILSIFSDCEVEPEVDDEVREMRTTKHFVRKALIAASATLRHAIGAIHKQWSMEPIMCVSNPCQV